MLHGVAQPAVGQRSAVGVDRAEGPRRVGRAEAQREGAIAQAQLHLVSAEGPPAAECARGARLRFLGADEGDAARQQEEATRRLRQPTPLPRARAHLVGVRVRAGVGVRVRVRFGPEPTSSAVSPSGSGCGGAVRSSTRSGASASLRGAGLASRLGQPLMPCAASLKRLVSHAVEAGLQTCNRVWQRAVTGSNRGCNRVWQRAVAGCGRGLSPGVAEAATGCNRGGAVGLPRG